MQQEQLDAYKEAQDLTAKQYANQQSIYKPMAAHFQSIFDMGPSQEGFSAEEENALNAGAIENTATNYKNAATAINENLAALGGGDSPITVGAQQQMKANTAYSAAGELSKEENQITQANYNQGYQQWLAAAQGLTSIAAGENPLGYESASTEAGGAASKTANDIAQEENSWVNAAIGAAGAIGGGLLSGGLSFGGKAVNPGTGMGATATGWA